MGKTEDYINLIRSVQKEFFNAYCTSYKDGYCIVWPVEFGPVVAIGKKPEKAWKEAAKVIKRKGLSKFKAQILKKEVKRKD